MKIDHTRRLLLLAVTSAIVSGRLEAAQKAKTVSAKTLKEAGGKLDLDITELQLVRVNLKGLETSAITLVSGRKRIQFSKWLQAIKAPAGTRNILLASRAESFPDLTQSQVDEINKLGNYESTSWTSEEHWYGCTEYSYWCRTRG